MLPWSQLDSTEDKGRMKALHQIRQRRQSQSELRVAQKSIDSIRPPQLRSGLDAAHQSPAVCPCDLAGSPRAAAGEDAARQQPNLIAAETDTAGKCPSPAGRPRPHARSNIEAAEENLWLSCGDIWSYGGAEDHGSHPRPLAAVPRNMSPRK